MQLTELRNIAKGRHIYQKRKGQKMTPPEGFDVSAKMFKGFSLYKRVGEVLARPYKLGEDLSDVSVSDTDVLDESGMICMNPEDHRDKWYVNGEYFYKNHVKV